MSDVLESQILQPGLAASEERLYGMAFLHLVSDQPEQKSEIIPHSEQLTHGLPGVSVEQVTSDSSTTYDPRVHETYWQYPDMRFELKQDWLYGTGVVPATSHSRLRAALLALKPHIPAEDFIDKQGVDERRIFLNKLAGAKITINNSDYRKGDFLPVSEAIETIYFGFVRQNHPIAQLITQLQEEHPELPKFVAHDIKAALVSGYAQEEIRRLYEMAVKQAKELAKASSPTSS
jgi:hypothetical protein